MSRVAVVTDSTADLPGELIERHGIRVVPLTVHFGAEEYKDYVEMGPDDFFQKLATSPHLPKTSQPSPADFAAVYEEVGKEARSIVSVHISSDLSGTYQSAMMARDMHPDLDIEVVDARSASLGTGLAVLAAAQAAARGEDKAGVAKAAGDSAAKLHVFFAVDTLEYLEKNGRIGKAQALLGGLLKIKPILTLDNGVVAPFDRVRGHAKAMARLVDVARETLGGKKGVRLAVIHGNAPDAARELEAGLRDAVNVADCFTGQVGPVVAAHAGPGVVGWAAHEV